MSEASAAIRAKTIEVAERINSGKARLTYRGVAPIRKLLGEHTEFGAADSEPFWMVVGELYRLAGYPRVGSC